MRSSSARSVQLKATEAPMTEGKNHQSYGGEYDGKKRALVGGHHEGVDREQSGSQTYRAPCICLMKAFARRKGKRQHHEERSSGPDARDHGQGKPGSRRTPPLRQRVQSETHQNRENQCERRNGEEHTQVFTKCKAGNDYRRPEGECASSKGSRQPTDLTFFHFQLATRSSSLMSSM